MKKNKQTPKEKSKKKFLVGIIYQTPSGRAGSKNYIIYEVNETKAQQNAESKFYSEKGKKYRIQGGDIIELKQS